MMKREKKFLDVWLAIDLISLAGVIIGAYFNSVAAVCCCMFAPILMLIIAILFMI